MKLTDKLLPILKNLNSCGGSVEWVGDRTVQEAEAAEAAHAIFYDYCGAAEYSAIAIRKKIWDSYGFDCDASYDAEEENQKQTADICRKYLKLEEK